MFGVTLDFSEAFSEFRFDPHAPVSECLWDIHVLKALSGDLQVRDGSLFQLEESVWVFCSEERRGEDKALHLSVDSCFSSQPWV